MDAAPGPAVEAMAMSAEGAEEVDEDLGAQKLCGGIFAGLGL